MLAAWADTFWTEALATILAHVPKTRFTATTGEAAAFGPTGVLHRRETDILMRVKGLNLVNRCNHQREGGEVRRETSRRNPGLVSRLKRQMGRRMRTEEEEEKWDLNSKGFAKSAART